MVTPGLAIDWHGREIIVPEEAGPFMIDQAVIEQAARQLHEHQGAGAERKPPKLAEQSLHMHKHVIIRLELGYRETEGGPVPAEPGSDCDTGPCVPGTIYEQYSVRFAPRPAREIDCGCEIPDLLDGTRIDHGALAKWVTRRRGLKPPGNPAIALANIRIRLDGEGPHHCKQEDIDIQVRPVVYSNDLLFQMLLCLNQRPGTQYS
jgi:hypothetical protein